MPPILTGSPFDLNDGRAYTRWRQAKLDLYPQTIDELIVNLQEKSPSDDEIAEITAICARANMAIYRLADPAMGDKPYVRALGQLLGLQRLDGNLCADGDSITSLQVQNVGRQSAYIPYTNRPLSWHTDGYYNLPDQQIRAILMHCVRNAAEGGDNLLLDHEIAYIQLRDKNPDYIKVLMRNDAMTIPPNVENGVEIRAEQSGPVFSVDTATGNLSMRYTARTRNIEWFDDDLTREAVTCLNELLTPYNPYVFTYRLNPGEGIICNNVLHSRTGFKDTADEASGRLLYRARYYDRIAHTDLNSGN
jgi:alpha-ketoglutarate-dependent taurine dioxygenase